MHEPRESVSEHMADLAAWDQGAHTYSDISEVDPFKEELDDPAFLALLGEVSGAHILDLGCGDGRLCRKLQALGAITTGLDGSPQMLARALEADPSGDYQIADMGSNYPLSATGIYDIVTAKMSLMCVNDLGAVASNARWALKKGGLFAVDIVHPFQPLLAKLLDQKSMYGLAPDYTYEKQTRGDISFGDTTFAFYSRPIDYYMNEISAAGFAHSRTQEIVISEDFAQQHPKYTSAANQPVSLHLLFQS